MERLKYEADFEKQRKLMRERYLRLKRNYVCDNSNERYQWAAPSLKNRYQTDVNVNNWVEERRDYNYLKNKRQPMSDFDHAYETEYVTRFGDRDKYETDFCEDILSSDRVAKSFPGHQPQLDLLPLKRIYDSYETTYRVSYQDPQLISTRKTVPRCLFCRLRMEMQHIR